MNWDTLFFMVFPYISLAIFVVVSIYRSVYRPFSVSSQSSQLLERRKLFWGSVPFHYGIVLVLLLHLLMFVLPGLVRAWNAAPVRLYLLEVTTLILALWALWGLLALTYRRASARRVQVVTSVMDVVVLALLLVSAITGILIATVYRFGSTWFTAIFAPYLASVFTLQPAVTMVTPLPWVIKLHVINFFLLLAVFPFSRLIHIAAYPIRYLVRPWQIVIWNLRPPTDKPLGQ
jgi:nitrate reductase gamma subunit